MMLFSNLGVAVEGGAWLSIYKEATLGKIVVMTCSQCLHFALFATAHLLLAAKYRTISKNIPALLSGKQPENSRRLWFPVLLVLNVVLPILAAFSHFMVHYYLLIGLDVPTWVGRLSTWSSFGTGSMLITSGVILVLGVWTIRRFFKESGAEDYINTGMLVRHAIAFGLFLVTNSAYFAVFSVHAKDPSDAVRIIFLTTKIFYILGSLGS